MFYPIIDFHSNDIKSFVKQWSSFYNYSKIDTKTGKDYYNDNINKQEELEIENLVELFEWKNGSILSGFDKDGDNYKRKYKSLNDKILAKISTINEFKKNLDIEDFKAEFGMVSFVWRIFLLHIISPNNYPIYDQHVHRAYLFLKGENSFKEIDETILDKQKEIFYFGTYLSFITELKERENIKIQDIDKAFFSFGQFLKKYKVQLEK